MFTVGKADDQLVEEDATAAPVEVVRQRPGDYLVRGIDLKLLIQRGPGMFSRFPQGIHIS